MGNGVKYETEIRRIGEFQTPDMQAMFDIVHNMRRRHQVLLVQSVSKKMSFLGKIAKTTLKLIQNAKVGGVSENSGYLLSNGH